ADGRPGGAGHRVWGEVHAADGGEDLLDLLRRGVAVHDDEHGGLVGATGESGGTAVTIARPRREGKGGGRGRPARRSSSRGPRRAPTPPHHVFGIISLLSSRRTLQLFLPPLTENTDSSGGFHPCAEDKR